MRQKKIDIANRVVGNIVPLPGMFEDDLSLNLNAMERHLDFLIDNGVKNVYLARAASEFEYMSRRERMQVTEMVTRKASDAPHLNVIAQPLGAHSLAELVEEAKEMVDLGADVLVIKLPDLKTEQKFFSSWYSKRKYDAPAHNEIFCGWLDRIGTEAQAKLILHDQPYRGSAYLKAATDLDCVVGIKTHEENPETRYDIYSRYGDKLICFDGMWKYHQLWSFTWGARARHTNWSWFDPVRDNEFLASVQNEDFNRAVEITNEEWPVAKAVVRTGYHGYKVLMHLTGLPYSGVRIPEGDVTKEEYKMLEDAAREIGLI